MLSAMPSKEPYLQLKLSWIGLVQFGITLYLLTVAIANINNQTTYPNVNTHKRTLWAMKNYKVSSNGIKYFNYTDPDTGEKHNGTLSHTWFDERLKGKYVYYFGTAFDNYCWPRETPPSEWFPSLFRSSQLKPWVQVPLRAAVLLGMTFRVFQAIVLAFMRLLQGDNPECKVQKTLLRIFVLNELVHNVCLFGVSNYLVTPDQKYFYLFGPALIMVYGTFGVKMLFSFWHLGLHVMTACRLALLILFASTFLPNINNMVFYLLHNFCDHYTTPLIAFYEYCALFCLVFSELLDIIQTRKFECTLGGTEEDYQDEDRMKNKTEGNQRISVSSE